jgi:hypothetical protein
MKRKMTWVSFYVSAPLSSGVFLINGNAEYKGKMVSWYISI